MIERLLNEAQEEIKKLKAQLKFAKDSARVELFQIIIDGFKDQGRAETVDWIMSRGRFEIDDLKKRAKPVWLKK